VTELAVARPPIASLSKNNPQPNRFKTPVTINRRSRIISFRLSPEEYESLRNLSLSNGARSISEFTRSAACQMASNGDTVKLDSALESLNNVISALDRHVERLSQILDKKETS
jgi:hypothetical protein